MIIACVDCRVTGHFNTIYRRFALLWDNSGIEKAKNHNISHSHLCIFSPVDLLFLSIYTLT
jgi:hypothetical protein